MKVFFVFVALVLIAVYFADALLPSSTQHKKRPIRPNRVTFRADIPLLRMAPSDEKEDDSLPVLLTHADIVWKLRPPPEMKASSRIVLRLAANLLRLDCMLRRVDLPVVLCPKGGQAVLEAHYQPPGSRLQKIGRFGITTQRGPSAPPISKTVSDLYGVNESYSVGSGAIVYMFVEPEYRKLGLGGLALEVISLIHAIQACDFTMLVADDDGSGKLVRWYEERGFSRAPLLQDLLGSPNEKYGVAMIAPTQGVLPLGCQIQWW